MDSGVHSYLTDLSGNMAPGFKEWISTVMLEAKRAELCKRNPL